MKRLLTTALIGVTALALVTACGQPVPGAAPKDALTSAPLDAGLVTGTFGWVLTADAVLLTTDGGKTFQHAKVDLPIGQARAAYFTDAAHGWVAALSGTGIAVARTADSGKTWTATTIPAKARLADLSVAFGDAARGALLAREQTGGAFSVADLFTTTDGGASWQPGTAPVAGRVSVEPGGRVWLAGGAQGNELYASTDRGANWTKAGLALTGGETPESVAPPANGMVAVSARSRVALLTSPDGGANWRESATVPLATDTAAAPAVSVASDSTVAVADPKGGRMAHLHAAAASPAATEPAAGLPAGVSRLTLVGSTGWALGSSGACAAAKRDCAITYHLSATPDNGTTWHEVLHWKEKLD